MLKITDLDQGAFVVEDSIDEVEVHTVPTHREIRLLLRRRVHRLTELADAHSRLPDWKRFAHALQGVE